jgi:hypothetical protein
MGSGGLRGTNPPQATACLPSILSLGPTKAGRLRIRETIRLRLLGGEQLEAQCVHATSQLRVQLCEHLSMPQDNTLAYKLLAYQDYIEVGLFSGRMMVTLIKHFDKDRRENQI